MKRYLSLLALAAVLIVAACDLGVVKSGPGDVALTTAAPTPSPAASVSYIVGCPTNYVVGTLEWNGTDILMVPGGVGGLDRPSIVRWPAGYTGRHSTDGQIDVLNARYSVVARTGTKVKLWGGYGGDGHWMACDLGIDSP